MSWFALDASPSSFFRRIESPKMPAAAQDGRLLKVFRELVARRSKDFNDQILESTDPSRFVILIRRLFEIAQSRICIYSDHLCRRAIKSIGEQIEVGGEYWSSFEVIDAARAFLEKDKSRFEIIVGKQLDCADGTTLKKSEFLRGIVESPNRLGVVTVLIAVDGHVGSQPLLDVNFVVADDNGYRIERPGDHTPALTRFGRPYVNQHLFSKFDGMVADFAKALQHNSKNCLKLVYGPKNKDVNVPTYVIGIENLDPSHLKQFLIDQVHCPHRPLEIAAHSNSSLSKLRR